jgi:hypothetical protein
VTRRKKTTERESEREREVGDGVFCRSYLNDREEPLAESAISFFPAKTLQKKKTTTEQKQKKATHPSPPPPTQRKRK